MRGMEENMKKTEIAILVDSGTDVPQELRDRYNMYVIPLRIIYKDEEFIDRISINAQTVYERLAEEIPKTSLPIGEDILNVLDQIKKDGYTKVIAVTISSGLSGTNNFLRNLTEDMEDLVVKVIDTKNISIGSGFLAMQAGKYLEEGMGFEETISKISSQTSYSKIFFTVSTLEYLKKGGRIGLVSATIGEMLNIKPIISCNEDGVYYTISKARGRKKSIDKIAELATEFAKTGRKYNIAVIHGNVPEEMEALRQKLEKCLPNAENIYIDQTGAALGVHTGPDVIGVGIQLLDE